MFRPSNPVAQSRFSPVHRRELCQRHCTSPSEKRTPPGPVVSEKPRWGQRLRAAYSASPTCPAMIVVPHASTLCSRPSASSENQADPGACHGCLLPAPSFPGPPAVSAAVHVYRTVTAPRAPMCATAGAAGPRPGIRLVPQADPRPGQRCTCRIIIRCRRTCLEVDVRTTLALDDDLVMEAQRLTGTNEKGALVRQALGALIERESARRLAQLGGSDPAATAVPRRQTMPA
jgi:Arc/MetJ family transcription regulator